MPPGPRSNIAPRVAVYPAGMDPGPAQEGWLLLAQAQSPGVFGDGSHPTTRLCAAAVDFHCRRRRPRAVLDVGTGTGILARIARARGAHFVVGTDIEPQALASAREQAALDSYGCEIRWSSEAPDHWGARFELLVANILEEPLRALAPALQRALAPGALLLISGFTRPQMPALRVLYEGGGLISRGHSSLEDWVVLMFEATGKSAA